MKITRLALGLALAGLSFGAQATNGYFAHGYGMKAKGMAGVSTTNTEDAFFGANNPAAAAFVGNRMDLGADLFSPIREIARTGSVALPPFPALDGASESESNYFLVPEFGYNRMLDPNLAVGVTVYGNGGMNTDYEPATLSCGPNTNLLCGSGSLGVDLMQLIVAPTVAYKVAPNHSIGVSPLVGYQRFKAEGLSAFQAISQPSIDSGVNAVTNNGYDDSFGYGVRVGYLGKITPTVTIGAAYASKMNFQEFDDYRGLFAEQGDFDIPENYNLGASWQATPEMRVALDYQRINYSDVRSIANHILPAAFNCFGGGTNTGNCLGQDNGPGFGWDDMDVWKLGVEYKYNKQWTLRAGYSHTDQPIPAQDVEFNMIAPAVVEDHVTLGFTFTRDNGDELTVAYMHAFKNDITGPSVFFSVNGGEDRLQMYQNSIGLQYSWKM